MAKPLALIIEDQANLAMLYEDALRLVGYDIFAIKDGLKALNHLQIAEAPDLIILDVNLPSLSGRDIHKHLRNSKKYDDTPVIILTANTLMIEQLRPACTKNDYLNVKPIGMKELQDLAKALMPTDDGTPTYMAETQKIPYLEDDYEDELETEKMERKSPTILRPDNSTIEISEHPIVDPKADTQEHKAIITPDDEVIAQEDDKNGTKE